MKTNLYEILRKPLVTEKSSYQSGSLGQYSFIVTSSATRTQIKDAIETLYDVTVKRINVINVPPKRGGRLRSRRVSFRKAGYKKAIVTLAEGQTLPLFEGVQ